MPNIESVVADIDLAVKDMIADIDDHYQRNFQRLLLIAMKYELSVDEALDAIRDAWEQWFESSPKLELIPPPELQDCQSPATEFDLKRLDRDGHLLTIYITAMKDGGPCTWTLEAPEDWCSDELVEVLENMALHYKHNPAPSEAEAH